MYSGKIISVAFPDTYVRFSENFIQEKMFPLVGLGKNGRIKAGHALLLLIENTTGAIHYYDFGRYVTPPKHGRVRSVLTDIELEIPLKAVIRKDKIENIETILKWLADHPEKTHADGRLVASVCHKIDFNKAESYLKSMQKKGSLPYNAFGNIGSNCSRLVTDTLIKASDDEKITAPLIRNNKFTPSPLGNVKYGAHGGDVYVVDNGEFSLYEKSLLFEIIFNYFDTTKAVKQGPKNIIKREGLHYLDGVGAGAFFEISKLDINFLIKRFTENAVLDFKGIFKINKSDFDITQKYEFIYDSHCLFCHVKQGNEVFRFDVVEKLTS